jgi:hypothetical protein
VTAPKPDYKAIATEAVGLLCRIGYLGLDRSRQRELWQMALDLDRKLHPPEPVPLDENRGEGEEPKL